MSQCPLPSTKKGVGFFLYPFGYPSFALLACQSSNVSLRFLFYRLEVYCGKKQDRRVVDTQGGPVAVIRNVQAVWPATDQRQRRTLVTDREYTSPALAIRLRRMGYDLIGTCGKRRWGFPDKIKMKSKKKPAKMPRGECAVVKHKTVRVTEAVPIPSML